jgi:ectoine hydroxylase-related dioxygenase (phytanoyl-CoA dioxygenase family)
MIDIDNALISEFQRTGAIVLRNVLDQPMLDELAEGVKMNLAKPSPRGIDYVKDAKTGEHFFHDAMLVNHNPHYSKVIFESKLAESVAKVMQAQALAISNVTVFLRSAGTKKRTRWHRDQPYWPAKGWKACSTWIPLDPVPLNTSLEFVSGSHLWGDIYERSDFRATETSQHLAAESARKEPFPDIEANRNDYDILSWQVNPGDCVMFHGMTTHGGSGNLPESMQRRTVSLQWFGDDVTFSPKEGGVDPDFLDEFEKSGMVSGHPIMGEICPQVWP